MVTYILLDRLCLLERPSRRDIGVLKSDNVNVRGLKHRFTIGWHKDVMDSSPLAVCYDCLCLISLIRTMMSLSNDGDGALEWIGHANKAYGCAPAGELGYLPRCWFSPLAMNGMTQYRTEIRGPGWSMMLNKTMYAGVRRCVCNRVIPPETCSEGRISLALIGQRASVGGSVSHIDWSRVNGAVDTSPGGVWINYIRQALGDSQSVVAAPVTGSLVCSILFSCRDITWTARFPLKWTVCGTDWVLPAGYQLLWQVIAEYCNMDAVDFLVVDNRAGVSHGTRRRQWWMFPRLVWCHCVTCRM